MRRRCDFRGPSDAGSSLEERLMIQLSARPAFLLILLLLLLTLTGAGCSSTPTVTIHESQRGSVFLEALSPGTLQATHPARLDSKTLRQILSGIRVKEEGRLLQHLMPNKPTPTPAFSEAEAAFLAPFAVTALEQATPDQVVRFRVTRRTHAVSETTGGALYVKHSAVYLRLTQYEEKPGTGNSAMKFDRRVQDATGLKEKNVRFTPKGVERPDLAAPSGLLGPTHLNTLVLDYQLLAKLRTLKPEPAPAPAPQPSQIEASSEPPAPSLEERVKQQDSEIEALREDLRSLKEEVRDGERP